jgi:hypothetical protein
VDCNAAVVVNKTQLSKFVHEDTQDRVVPIISASAPYKPQIERWMLNNITRAAPSIGKIVGKGKYASVLWVLNPDRGTYYEIREARPLPASTRRGSYRPSRKNANGSAAATWRSLSLGKPAG